MVDSNKFWPEEPEEEKLFSEKDVGAVGTHQVAALKYLSTKSIVNGIVFASEDIYSDYVGRENEIYFGDTQQMHISIETFKLELSSSIEALMEMAIQGNETIEDMRKKQGVYPNSVDGRNVDEEKKDDDEEIAQHIGLSGNVPEYDDCETTLEKELWLQAESILVYANKHIEYLECITILHRVLEMCNNFDIDEHNKMFNREGDDESDED